MAAVAEIEHSDQPQRLAGYHQGNNSAVRLLRVLNYSVGFEYLLYNFSIRRGEPKCLEEKVSKL